jgi:D-serine deaminase-like pyridoxal phosphate-dependent protein
MLPQALTPYILIDAAAVRRNLAQLAQYTARHKLGLRPHTKTHKSTFLARMQIESGAVGLTVAKSGEAQIMARVCQDILMAYPALDPARCQLLAELARDHALRMAIDSIDAADAIASAASAAGVTIGILVDLDVGLHRTGVQNAQDALALAQHISRKRGLRLDGLLFYPGQLGLSTADQDVALAAIDQQLAEVLDLWRKSGLEARVLSGGSTPTANNSHLVTRMTEIRPGTYIFNDMNCVRAGCCTLDDCAARIITTVISTAVPNQIVLDAGSKTLTSDRCGPAPESGHGHIIEYPDAKITKLSEEHAQVDISRCQRRPKVAERVSVIPNHICPCVNLQDTIWWREGDDSLPLLVEARGRVY